MPRQIKSKERVAEHGEVFTNEREVNAMLDLVKSETDRIESRFLEPAAMETSSRKFCDGSSRGLSDNIREIIQSIRRMRFSLSPASMESTFRKIT